MHARRLWRRLRALRAAPDRGDQQEYRGTPQHLLTALAVAFLAVPGGAMGAQVRREYRELHMGMEVRVVLYARDDQHARDAARAAFDRIAELEDIMSDYRPESEVRRLERRVGERVRVSPALFFVLARARTIAEHTNGAFDPTIGPLVALWREARRTRRLPDARSLDSARALVGWRRLTVRHGRQEVNLERPGMRLDLGGVAKGYIVQEAAHVLRRRGAPSAMVEAGGDIAVGDAPPGEQGWRIEVPNGGERLRAVASELRNVVISTSGPGTQFVEIEGKRYSHVVDARTGMPLTTTSQATVVATDGALADALATALTLVSPKRRERLMNMYRSDVRAWSATP